MDKIISNIDNSFLSTLLSTSLNSMKIQLKTNKLNNYEILKNLTDLEDLKELDPTYNGIYFY